MNDERIDKVVAAAEKAKRVPERLEWPITAVLYGHGKVIVQAVSPSGRCAQFTEKV